MIKSLFISIGLFSSTYFAFSQSLPLLRANSEKISMRDGNSPLTRYWDHLSTTLKPVVYHINKANQTRTVVFYTDIDSIAFKVSPGRRYNFKVLLRKKDTCYAQLSTVFQSAIKNETSRKVNIADTVPFTLGPDHYIHIKGSINHSKQLDLIFDTGANVFILTDKGLPKSKVILDGTTENRGVGGFSTEKTSSSNSLELGKLHWKELPMLFYDYKGWLNADGVVGFNIFEDKIVEIDYDKGLLILHEKLPNIASSYSKLPTQHGPDGTFVKASLQNGKQIGSGWFLLDTGGSLTVAISGDFTQKYDLQHRLEITGYPQIIGTGSTVNKVQTAVLPGLNLAGFILEDVPVQFNLGKSGHYQKEGIIGNAVLKRFNVLIDYPNGKIYIKPNHLLHTRFTPLNWKKILSITAIGFAILAIGLILYFKQYLLRKLPRPQRSKQ
ncbi:aspartyl protease family protein [Flavobacterium sp. FlaQc-48]|uniref:aspartyl protease family protein n=1 Tax=Flavobacterium sp. FlaQc-48 TaxID=3374181 RepID=UPI003756CA4E